MPSAPTAGSNPEPLLGQQPEVAGASSSSGPAVAGHVGDVVRDLGSFGIYQANWGGTKANREVRTHV